ncbi:hypothetical protein OGAPHI_004293 [Ogataea philodendri]|uniref:Uncharacterized protein n=1 Tax=Ogataea philodendri TaxID=1378263 RepID=A0A9P8P7I8_9ASCO|nr:uncharacterized protein OGAPHI_004293 [Ogataea philodendri]KAH3666104.1 hypothetical protein OGAPHI_004293 [Ogataea philodendri]
MHQLLFEHAISKFNHSPLEVLKIYNELKYLNLDNLDSLKGHFPSKPHIASVNSLSLDPVHERYLFSGGGESAIKMWDLDQQGEIEELEPIFELPAKSAHKFGITHLKWWSDNGLWLSSSFDHTLKVWDANEMREVHSFNLGSRIVNFDFEDHGGNSLVAVCADGGVGGLRLMDLRTLASTHTLGGGGKLQGGFGYMLSCKWSPANPYLVVGGSQDGYCIGWDVRRSDGSIFKLDYNLTTINYRSNTRQLLLHENIPKAHNGGINSILFTEDGAEMVTLGSDDKIKVWDLTSSSKPLNKQVNFGPLIRNKSNQHITMALSPINETELQYLWFPSDNGELLVYRLEDGKLLARLNKGGGAINRRTTSIVYGKRSSLKYYSGCQDGTISTWGYNPLLESQSKEDNLEFESGEMSSNHIEEPKSDILNRIHDEMEANQIRAKNTDF